MFFATKLFPEKIEWLDEENVIITVRIQRWPWKAWRQSYLGREGRWKDLDTDVRAKIEIEVWLSAIQFESRMNMQLERMDHPQTDNTPRTLPSTRIR